jgi:outer membrane biogenesis lipoprotein LolB
MKTCIKIFLLFSFSILIGCSDDGGNGVSEAKKDHVWKEQTETIDKAKEVEGMLLEAAENKRITIE